MVVESIRRWSQHVTQLDCDIMVPGPPLGKLAAFGGILAERYYEPVLAVHK
jgi:hypothetical protein